MANPTLADIAHATGSSISTVSLALRASGRISGPRRAKIIAASQALGYRPNVAAAALVSNRSPKPAVAYSIALVTDYFCDEYSPTYFTSTSANIEKHVLEMGYSFEHFRYDQLNLSAKAFRNMLYQRGFNGIIFADIRSIGTRLLEENWEEFSVVCLGRTRYRTHYNVVRSYPDESVRVAWREVRQRGYRRIGLVLYRHTPPMLDDDSRDAAAYLCQKELGPQEVAIDPCQCAHHDRTSFLKWIKSTQPDAVICFNEGDYWALRSTGYQFPKDIGCALLHLVNVGLAAGVKDPELDLARLGIQFIDQHIRHHKIGRPMISTETLARGVWYEGPTLEPLRG